MFSWLRVSAELGSRLRESRARVKATLEKVAAGMGRTRTRHDGNALVAGPPFAYLFGRRAPTPLAALTHRK